MEHEALVRDTWAALSHGDLEPLRKVLSADARWRAVEDGPWNCPSRAAILDVMQHNLDTGLAGSVEQVQELGERTLVAFRPSGRGNPAWPLEDGVRWMVLTWREDEIVEMKGCADRAAALAYAGA